MGRKPTRLKAEQIANDLMNGNRKNAAYAFKGFSGREGAAQALMVAMEFRPDLEEGLIRDLLSQLLIRTNFQD